MNTDKLRNFATGRWEGAVVPPAPIANALLSAADELERLRAALADAATCSNDECHGAHVALEALRPYQQRPNAETK